MYECVYIYETQIGANILNIYVYVPKLNKEIKKMQNQNKNTRIMGTTEVVNKPEHTLVLLSLDQISQGGRENITTRRYGLGWREVLMSNLRSISVCVSVDTYMRKEKQKKSLSPPAVNI